MQPKNLEEMIEAYRDQIIVRECLPGTEDEVVRDIWSAALEYGASVIPEEFHGAFPHGVCCTCKNCRFNYGEEVCNHSRNKTLKMCKSKLLEESKKALDG